MDHAAPAPRSLHGYSPEEQARLVEQAEYWRERLILPDLHDDPHGDFAQLVDRARGRA